MADSGLPFTPRTVVFDADSTLVSIEGVDWLAEGRSADVADRIAALTADAMSGERSLEAVYGDRLGAVAPSHEEITALGEAYVRAVAPGAVELVRDLKRAGIRPVIVSGGLRDALLPLGAHLGIPAVDVHGVGVRFKPDGAYLDFDRASPLAQQGGKAELVAKLALERPLVVVGDGSTDLAIRTAGAADCFVAYVGFVQRASVARAADFTTVSFAALHALLLPPR